MSLFEFAVENGFSLTNAGITNDSSLLYDRSSFDKYSPLTMNIKSCRLNKGNAIPVWNVITQRAKTQKYTIASQSVNQREMKVIRHNLKRFIKAHPTNQKCIELDCQYRQEDELKQQKRKESIARKQKIVDLRRELDELTTANRQMDMQMIEMGMEDYVMIK